MGALPKALSGLHFGATPEVITEVREILSENQNADLLITDLIFHGQFVPSEINASRLLIRLSGSGKKNGGKNVSGVGFVEAPAFPRAVAIRIPIAFSDSVNEIVESNKLIGQQREHIERLTHQIQALENDVSTARIAVISAEERARTFEMALNGSEEHRNFVQIINALSDLKSSVESGNAEVKSATTVSINQIGFDITQKIASFDQKLAHISQKKSQSNAPSTPNNLHTFPKRPVPRWLVWASAVVAILLLIAAIIAFTVGRSEIESKPEIPRLDASIDAPPAVVPSGEKFDCTPQKLWDGDGPIWCKEGPRVRLAGINARELRDNICQEGAPCPNMSGIQARDLLANLLADVSYEEPSGHVVLVGGATLSCISNGDAVGNRTGGWCQSPKSGDLSCRLLELGGVAKWEKYWADHECEPSGSTTNG